MDKPNLQRYLFRISYSGTSFHGWQRQESQISVQSTIESCLSKIENRPISIVGCGRTDAGVHASCYYFHVDLTRDMAKEQWTHKLNQMLPHSIAVHNIVAVSDEVHARFSAINRGYIYRIHLQKDPFKEYLSFEYNWKDSLDVNKLNDLNDHVLAQSSFAPLCKEGSDVEHYRCVIKTISWEEIASGVFHFSIESNRFLRGMIRLMVGMYLNYERDKISVDQILSAFDTQTKLPINWSVAPHGLYLNKVEYPVEILTKPMGE